MPPGLLIVLFSREDDENDFSDEESAVNSRLNMNYIEAEKNELRANRENFLAYEHGDKKYARSENSDEDMSPRDRSPDNQLESDPNDEQDDDDSEEDRWEK